MSGDKANAAKRKTNKQKKKEIKGRLLIAANPNEAGAPIATVAKLRQQQAGATGADQATGTRNIAHGGFYRQPHRHTRATHYWPSQDCRG